MLRPKSPVLPDYEAWDKEINVAEHQQEYNTLPCLRFDDGLLLTRWELNDSDLEEIAKHRSIYVFVHTFGNPVQPMMIQAEKPELVELVEREPAMQSPQI